MRWPEVDEAVDFSQPATVLARFISDLFRVPYLPLYLWHKTVDENTFVVYIKS